MGDLIVFRPSANLKRPNDDSASQRNAQILFFTGVRYKREAEPIVSPTEQDAPPKGGMDGAGGGRRKRRG
jgi:hypothetical protein